MGGRERGKKGGVLLLERSCTPEGPGNTERRSGGLKRINIMSPHNCICTSVEAAQDSARPRGSDEIISSGKNRAFGDTCNEVKNVHFGKAKERVKRINITLGIRKFIATDII